MKIFIMANILVIPVSSQEPKAATEERLQGQSQRVVAFNVFQENEGECP